MRKINPVKNNNSIQIKFNLRGTTYRFTPIPGAEFDNPSDYDEAKSICDEIARDIKNNRFDKSLKRYISIPQKAEIVNIKYLINLVELWVSNLDISEKTKAGHYQRIIRKIKKYNPKVLDTDWLLKDEIAEATFNKYLTGMKSCFRWAVKKGYVDSNPWLDIKGRKLKTRKVITYTSIERSKIIEKLKEPEYSHYHDFIYFLMSAGCRLSEAIGITWNNIDFQNSEIIISQSLSRDPRFNDYQRTMSTRKADGVVYIDMKNDLKEILLKRYEVKLPKEDYKDGYDLVFRSPRGKIISNSNLIQYCWKPLLESLDIPYRNLQNHRHTFASEAIRQGASPVDVAYLLGHKNTTMVIKTYTHIIDRPKTPNIVN